jgi:HAMP domain-containing protein
MAVKLELALSHCEPLGPILLALAVADDLTRDVQSSTVRVVADVARKLEAVAAEALPHGNRAAATVRGCVEALHRAASQSAPPSVLMEALAQCDVARRLMKTCPAFLPFVKEAVALEKELRVRLASPWPTLPTTVEAAPPIEAPSLVESAASTGEAAAPVEAAARPVEAAARPVEAGVPTVEEEAPQVGAAPSVEAADSSALAAPVEAAARPVEAAARPVEAGVPTVEEEAPQVGAAPSVEAADSSALAAGPTVQAPVAA